jgi:hypothetical protein
LPRRSGVRLGASSSRGCCCSVVWCGGSQVGGGSSCRGRNVLGAREGGKHSCWEHVQVLRKRSSRWPSVVLQCGEAWCSWPGSYWWPEMQLSLSQLSPSKMPEASPECEGISRDSNHRFSIVALEFLKLCYCLVSTSFTELWVVALFVNFFSSFSRQCA